MKGSMWTSGRLEFYFTLCFKGQFLLRLLTCRTFMLSYSRVTSSIQYPFRQMLEILSKRCLCSFLTREYRFLKCWIILGWKVHLIQMVLKGQKKMMTTILGWDSASRGKNAIWTRFSCLLKITIIMAHNNLITRTIISTMAPQHSSPANNNSPGILQIKALYTKVAETSIKST